MASIKTQSAYARLSTRFQDYLELCKPRVVALMVFTALVGMLLSAPGEVGFVPLIFGNLGIALMAGSAAAINHLADRHVDALMRRTRFAAFTLGAIGCFACTHLCGVDRYTWHVDTHCIREYLNSRAEPTISGWLRGRLHAVFKARHAAKYCDWRRGGRYPSVAGLDGGNR